MRLSPFLQVAAFQRASAGRNELLEDLKARAPRWPLAAASTSSPSPLYAPPAHSSGSGVSCMAQLITALSIATTPQSMEPSNLQELTARTGEDTLDAMKAFIKRIVVRERASERVAGRAPVLPSPLASAALRVELALLSFSAALRSSSRAARSSRQLTPLLRSLPLLRPLPLVSAHCPHPYPCTYPYIHNTGNG